MIITVLLGIIYGKLCGSGIGSWCLLSTAVYPVGGTWTWKVPASFLFSPFFFSVSFLIRSWGFILVSFILLCFQPCSDLVNFDLNFEWWWFQLMRTFGAVQLARTQIPGLQMGIAVFVVRNENSSPFHEVKPLKTVIINFLWITDNSKTGAVCGLYGCIPVDSNW